MFFANLPKSTVTGACDWSVFRFVVFFVCKMYFCWGFLVCRVSSEIEEKRVLYV